MSVPVGRGGLGCVNRAGSPFREHTSVVPWGFLVCFGWTLSMVGRLWWALSIVALSITHASVSVANNFIHCPTADDYGYHAFGELARFIYCLLQKIKQGSSLPLVEQWDEYVLPNHSKFPPISGGEFLAGTRVLAALNKIGSSYLRREFERDARRFLEEFTTSSVDCGCSLKDWTGVELFLSGDRHRG